MAKGSRLSGVTLHCSPTRLLWSPALPVRYALLGVERVRIMLDLNDISTIIRNAVIEAIEPSLDVDIRPEFSNWQERISLTVRYGGVTLCYTSYENCPGGRGSAIREALQGSYCEDALGSPARCDGQSWTLYIEIEDEDDPFLDVVRRSLNEDEFVYGTPWQVIDHAESLLATWAFQAGMDDLRRR